MQLIYLCTVFTVSVNGTPAYCAVCQTHTHSPENMQILFRLAGVLQILSLFFDSTFFFFQFASRRCRFVSVGSSRKLSATWQNLLPKILIRKLRNTEYSACAFSWWPNYKIVCWFSAKCHIMSDASVLSLTPFLPLSLSLCGHSVAKTMNIFAQVLREFAANKQKAKICKLNIRIICEKYYILIALTIYFGLQNIFTNLLTHNF